MVLLLPLFLASHVAFYKISKVDETNTEVIPENVSSVHKGVAKGAGDLASQSNVSSPY